MSGTYRALGGEGWSDVARSTTGNDMDAAQIQAANPGVPTPIPAGTVLQLPVAAPDVRVEAAVELEVSVEGTSIGTLDDFAVVSSIDAISKGGFTIPNEPETRALFRPLTNPSITIDIDGLRVFTGAADSPKAANAPGLRSLDISCFSTPGILERVPPPISAFPLEFINANLQAIAGDLCSFHGVPLDFQASTGARFARVDIRPNQNIFPFLAELAAQRGLILTSSAAGELVFWGEVAKGDPVSRVEVGKTTIDSLHIEINEDRFYSSVTGTIPAKSKKSSPGVSFSVINPHASDLVRPYTFGAPDIDEGELEPAVNAAAGRMFAEVFTASLTVPTWYTDKGGLYQPNTTIELKGPDYYIDDFYEFLITNVVLSKRAKSKAAALTLALPGVFSGEIPESLPWR